MRLYTPVAAMLKRYRSKMRFHVPGHKGKQRLLGRAARWDITELSFSDDLAQPAGVLKEAEELLAEAYGAERAYFTTDGATSGVLATFAPFAGKIVLIDRYSHRSAYAALELFGVTPAFFRGYAGLFPNPPTAEEIAAALAAHPEAAAVFLTAPDYYGRCADVAGISRIVRGAGKALVVDASHGSHYAFSPLLPPCPARHADLAILSLHKTGLAAGQAAAVLVNDAALAAGVRRALEMLRTSSPSYLILSTIDFSRAFMVQCYRKRAEKQARAVDKLRSRLAGSDLRVLSGPDFTRLVADVSSLGLSGFTAEKRLNAMGVYPEMADFSRVVFVLSAMDAPARVAALCRALKRLAKSPRGYERPPELTAPERVLPYNAAGEARRVKIAESVGRVAAENAGLYPPAVPLVLRGERIARTAAALLASAGREDIEVFL